MLCRSWSWLRWRPHYVGNHAEIRGGEPSAGDGGKRPLPCRRPGACNRRTHRVETSFGVRRPQAARRK